jgi:hypothetical protein
MMNDDRKLKRRGPFVPLSYAYPDDPAIMEAGEKAELLYVRGLAWSKRPEATTDGFISDAELAWVGRGLGGLPARAHRLCAVRLWVRDDTVRGWWIRTWLDWNPSRAELEQARRRDAERKRQARGQPP